MSPHPGNQLTEASCKWLPTLISLGNSLQNIIYGDKQGEKEVKGLQMGMCYRGLVPPWGSYIVCQHPRETLQFLNSFQILNGNSPTNSSKGGRGVLVKTNRGPVNIKTRGVSTSPSALWLQIAIYGSLTTFWSVASQSICGEVLHSVYDPLRSSVYGGKEGRDVKKSCVWCGRMSITSLNGEECCSLYEL